MMANENELEEFRQQWKKEVLKSKELSVHCDSSNTVETHRGRDGTSTSSFSRHNKKIEENDDPESNFDNNSAGCSSTSGTNQDKRVGCKVDNPFEQELENNSAEHETYYPFMILGKFLREGSVKSENDNEISENCKRKYFDEHDNVDIYISEKRLKKKDYSLKQENSSIEHSAHLVVKERYLDLFIADLDEINEIPFFDITLAREVGIKIFQYLDMKDLCRCAQVSKSWRSLADDELLWCRICHKLGYEEKTVPVERKRWKEVVRYYVERKILLITNWKGRLGHLSHLQHVRGGVLCAVHSCEDMVVAGYNNGQVKLWDLGTGGNCLFQPSSTALAINENEDEGTVSNYVLHIATSDTITMASYKHGFVDVWQNEEGTNPVYTFACQGGWDISGLTSARSRPLFAMSQGHFVYIHQAECHTKFSVIDKLDLNTMVSHIKWLEPQENQYNADYALAVATPNIVNIYTPGSGPGNMTEIHNLIGMPVMCVDLRTDPNQMAVGHGCFGGPLEGFKVKMYDLSNGRILSTLQGHTWIVMCLNLAESPRNQLVTGSADRRVRVFDLRGSTYPVITLQGHSTKVSSVQMDDWKVVSSDEGGFVCVWDQRMKRKLWEWHNRHPVKYCHYYDSTLVVGNVPYDKFPMNTSSYEYEAVSHSRFRGSLQVYDFSVDQTTQGVPGICLSTYDEPEAYDYNIKLALPYDTI